MRCWYKWKSNSWSEISTNFHFFDPHFAGKWIYDREEKAWIEDGEPPTAHPELNKRIKWKLTELEFTEAVAILQHNRIVDELRSKKTP